MKTVNEGKVGYEFKDSGVWPCPSDHINQYLEIGLFFFKPCDLLSELENVPGVDEVISLGFFTILVAVNEGFTIGDVQRNIKWFFEKYGILCNE